MNPFLLEAAAGLFVAAIVATFGYSSGKRSLQRKIDDAPVAYLASLDDLISKSVAEGKFKASANAREILTQSAALKQHLEGMLQPLRSSFEELERSAMPGQIGDTEETFDAIHSLQASWPGQSRVIESDTRRLLELLGIE